MMRQQILDTIHDMVQDFLYYDRKKDEQLPVGAIDQAIANGEISVDEIVEAFKAHLIENIKGE